MRKYLLFIILLSGLTLGARGQSDPEIDLSGLPQKTTASSLRYWFDSDANSVKTASISGSATTIDASALKEGIHTIHYQIVDSKGIAGIPASKMFIKLDARTTAEAASLRYWFDTDANIKTTTTLSGATSIDASGLKEGIHTVHYQIMDNQGTAGITDSKMFIKLDAKTTAKAASLRYWFDTNKGSVVETALAEGAQIVDASALAEGIHILHYQIIDDKGNVDIPVSAMFIKIAKKVAATPVKIRYWFNEDDANIKETALDLANLTLTIDASDLPKGTHELHMQLVTAEGELSPATSGSFASIIIKKGDVNNDGKVDATDVVVITDYMADSESVTIDKTNADFNDDEKINIADVLGIVNIIVITEGTE